MIYLPNKQIQANTSKYKQNQLSEEKRANIPFVF
jgi:hypothetical protein